MTHKLVKMECKKNYATQIGLEFVWDGYDKTSMNPEGTAGLADSFMIGWPLEKVAAALRRLADSLEREARS